MGKKHEDIQNPRMFYCFVDLGKSPSDMQKVYVVPSSIVAKVVRESHLSWLNAPGSHGHVRKDSGFRRLLPDYTKVFGDQTIYCQGWLDSYHEDWKQLAKPRLGMEFP